MYKLEYPALEVTSAQVFPVNTEGKLRAFARIVLSDQIQLTSLRIYEGSIGLFVSYPNDPMHKGEDYRQLFYPVEKSLRDRIERSVLLEYSKSTEIEPYLKKMAEEQVGAF